jgi:hypothetical protein
MLPLQLSLSCEAVREKRFREMESLDSLLALVPAGYAEKQAAEEAAAVALSIRSNSKASDRSRRQVSAMVSRMSFSTSGTRRLYNHIFCHVSCTRFCLTPLVFACLTLDRVSLVDDYLAPLQVGLQGAVARAISRWQRGSARSHAPSCI